MSTFGTHVPLWKRHASLTSLNTQSPRLRPSHSLSNITAPLSRTSSYSSIGSSFATCTDCERTRIRVTELEMEKREWNREKRSLARKISEMEEEIKSLGSARNDHTRLKDENRALIRVISKLSK